MAWCCLVDQSWRHRDCRQPLRGHPGKSFVDVVSKIFQEVTTVAKKHKSTVFRVGWIELGAIEIVVSLCAVTLETACRRGLKGSLEVMTASRTHCSLFLRLGSTMSPARLSSLCHPVLPYFPLPCRTDCGNHAESRPRLSIFLLICAQSRNRHRGSCLCLSEFSMLTS